MNKYCFRPQQGLTFMNNYFRCINLKKSGLKFPSPTGVNYYEQYANVLLVADCMFPSPTGVNYYEFVGTASMQTSVTSFRPQQGLTIMNPYLQNPDKHYLK